MKNQRIEKSLKEMIQDVLKSRKGYNTTGVNDWNYRTGAFDLSVQLGSLNRLIMQYDNDRHPEGKSKEDFKQNIADELADILSMVLFIAHELGIDVHDAWEKMLASDKKKISHRLRQ